MQNNFSLIFAFIGLIIYNDVLLMFLLYYKLKNDGKLGFILLV